MAKITNKEIEKIIRLRVKDKKCNIDISRQTKIPYYTIKKILEDYPLSKEDYKKSWSRKVSGKQKQFDSIVGLKFNKLTVIKRVEREIGKSHWLCLCDCGREKIIVRDSLISGYTKSCGCLRTLEGKTGKKNIGYIQSIVNTYKHHAKKTNREWLLTLEDCQEIFESNCYYCKSPPNNIKKSSQGTINFIGNYYYNGIDRVDNSVGYIKDNVVSCCKYCNYAKRDRSYQEFVSWIDNLVNNRNNLR